MMEDKGRELLRMQDDIDKAEEFRKIVQQRLIEDPTANAIVLKHQKGARISIINDDNPSIYGKVVDKNAGLYLVHQEKADGTHESKIYTEDEIMSID